MVRCSKDSLPVNKWLSKTGELVSMPEVYEVLALLGITRHEHKGFKLLYNSQIVQGNLLTVDSALQVLSSFGIIAFVLSHNMQYMLGL